MRRRGRRVGSNGWCRREKVDGRLRVHKWRAYTASINTHERALKPEQTPMPDKQGSTQGTEHAPTYIQQMCDAMNRTNRVVAFVVVGQICHVRSLASYFLFVCFRPLSLPNLNIIIILHSFFSNIECESHRLKHSKWTNPNGIASTFVVAGPSARGRVGRAGSVDIFSHAHTLQNGCRFKSPGGSL